ncbi:hypothetical protein [Aureibacillus halotolerans]|uniref:Uncharacterized protein n=1 Tax=Aureibacillus halotolerans TaxID=1508390 RepID=A0A4R6U8Y2_9BACI|nr:hypothetical protein [Aureibacillus halotolerans]TDQ42212.1 hypothetical protein EV213_102243 [Aureibacillus halotolerans]
MTISKMNWKSIAVGTTLFAILVLSACSGGGEDSPEEEPVMDTGTTEDASTEVNETDEEDMNDNEAPDSDSADAEKGSDDLS